MRRSQTDRGRHLCQHSQMQCLRGLGEVHGSVQPDLRLPEALRFQHVAKHRRRRLQSCGSAATDHAVMSVSSSSALLKQVRDPHAALTSPAGASAVQTERWPQSACTCNRLQALALSTLHMLGIPTPSQRLLRLGRASASVVLYARPRCGAQIMGLKKAALGAAVREDC